MAKRGRKPKNPTLAEALNPKVVREVGGVIVGAVAVIALLGVFGAAGVLGKSLFGFFYSVFGVVSYLFLFWLLFLAAYYLNQEVVKRSRIILWGSLIFLIFLSALVAPFGSSGGIIGNGFFGAIASIAGQIATILIMFVATIAAAVLTFNISISEILETVKSKAQTNYPKTNLKEGVSVFKTIRRRIGMSEKNKQSPSVPVISASADGSWEFPSIELLEQSTGKAQPGNISKNVDVLKKTLSDFGVDPPTIR